MEKSKQTASVKSVNKSNPCKMTLPRNIFRPWDESEKSLCGSIPEKVEESKSCYSVTNSKLPKPSALLEKRSEQSSASDKADYSVLHPYSHCAMPCTSNLLNSLPGYLKYEPSSSQMHLARPTPTEDSSYQRNADSPSKLFLYPVAINDLANLSRNDLTAIGLLPPEPPSNMKAKRQRPKRFHCPHCQVAFSNNGQLRGHIRIHTGERPFMCEQEGCGKSFTRNEELTRHRRIHTGLRPFPCSICGKKFGRKDHLKKHTRTHQRVMYTTPNMIGYGNPFQPFHPPILSTAVTSDPSLPLFSSVPSYSFSVLPSMNHSLYPSLSRP